MPLDPIARYRRFSRIVTAELGALDTSFLGRGRPLGAARVLTAVAAGRGDVADLRRHLNLDSGLASRLLRTLESEGARAQAMGVSVLRLDTNSALPEAEALYRRSGWVRIERYNDDPYPDLFFEKRLGCDQPPEQRA